MLDDTDRSWNRRPGLKGWRSRPQAIPAHPWTSGELVRECVEVARASHHLAARSLRYENRSTHGAAAGVLGDSEDYARPVSNVSTMPSSHSGRIMSISSVRGASILRNEKRVTLSVRDQGVGVPAEELKRIFKRFYAFLIVRRVM